LEIFKKALGDRHPRYAATLDNLAMLYQAMGAYAKAVPLHQKALDIRKQTLGDRHPDYATSLHNLAGLYGSLRRWPEALQAEDGAGRCFRHHVSRVLPALSERDQLSFLRT